MKIVFILNSYGKSRYDKRIEEFIERGYDCEVYVFKRFEGDSSRSSFPVEVLGCFDNSLSYARRTKIIYNALKSLLKNKKGQNVIYYIFGLDVAMLFWLIRKKEPYIYEEGDLVHTYMKNNLIRKTLESVDKKVIRNSELTVFTSEGFPEYHFGKRIENSVILPNKISKRILQIPLIEKKQPFDINHLNIGFVGAPRFDKILKFFEVACKNFPQHRFHIFGGPVPEEFEKLKSYSNLLFHGPFKTPDDLPEIYSHLDLVLSTYDTDSDNVRYAEPNKLYEAIYFETPIIVSRGTFLGEKVKKLNVGFEIDVTEQNVIRFLNELSLDKINAIVNNIRRIPKENAVDDGSELFIRIDDLLNSHS